MSLTNELLIIQSDPFINSYFKNTSLSEFIKSYIQVDMLIKKQNISSNIDIVSLISEHFLQFKNTITQQMNESNNNQLTHLTNQLSNNNKDTTINILQNMQSTVTNTINEHNITSKIHKIDSTLETLYGKFTGSSHGRGEFAENILFDNMIKLFPSSDITNTTCIKHSGDILIKQQDKPDIMIESKNFKANVKKLDIDKFHSDCELNNFSGILCNLYAGITNKEHFQVDIKDGRVYVYLSNHEFNNSMFKLAVTVIYNIHNIIKDYKTDIVSLDKELFESIKSEFNTFFSKFKIHLDTIKQNVNALEVLSMDQIQYFFKKSNFEPKSSQCNYCRKNYKNDKTLKIHKRKYH